MSKNEMIPTNGYTALEGFSLTDALSEEMAGMDITFDRVSIPVGGGTVFEMPGENPGETDAVKEFTGVILYHHPLQVYYSESFNGSNNPPDCLSNDGVTGVGNPGGTCVRCPLNQFGTGANGGKACKSKRRLFVLRPGEVLPLVLTLPIGSLKEFSAYVKRLLSRGLKTCMVATRFSLKKATNAGGIVFSQAQFALDRRLTPEELGPVESMAAQIRTYAAQMRYEDEAAPEINPFTGEVLELLPTDIQ